MLGKRAGWRGPRMRRLPSRGGCAEKRGGVVGAAVLAAVGEGAAAGFLVLRTDAIGAPGKVRIQPQTGPGEGEWNPARCALPTPTPGSEQSPGAQNPSPIRPMVWVGPPTPPRRLLPPAGSGLSEPSPAYTGAHDPNPCSRPVCSLLSFLREEALPPPQPLLDHSQPADPVAPFLELQSWDLRPPALQSMPPLVRVPTPHRPHP